MSLNGIDISSYQAGINLSAVPCDFVIVKATEGTSYINPHCNTQAEQTLNTGKKLGLYHFASGGNAVSEADYFVDNIAGYLGKALLVLDWEAEAISRGPAWAKQWLDRVHQRTGTKPLIYMSNSVVNSYDWSAVAAGDYGLWNAGYYAGYETMGYNPDAPLYGGLGAWGGCTIYQYTSSGRLNGWNGNLDLDVFYGDVAAWDAYIKGNKIPVSPAPPAPAAPGINTAPNTKTAPAINFTYKVYTEDDGWLPEVVNLSDYAGVCGHWIRNIAIKTDMGKVKYRVHIKDKDWLPWVTGYNTDDHDNGYAGNSQPIDAIQVYYETPKEYADKFGFQKAQYRVSPVNGDYWPWQYDDETGSGQDGYAGCYGQPLDRFQLF